MQRGVASRWALGVVCWLGVAAASAGAVIAYTSHAPDSVELGIDIVRVPATGNGDWQVRALPASAARLFFSPDKGPRADIESTTAETGARIELASASPDPAGLAFKATRSRLQVLLGQAAADRSAEKTCLAEVIYFEARGQPVEAQSAVGQTVINRVLSGVYPKTLCGVAHQHGVADGQCQYSFACDSLANVPKDRSDWSLAEDIAERLLSGQAWNDEIGDATHSHPLAEHPAWVKYLHRVKRIGAIVFYRGDFAQAPQDRAPTTD